MTISWTSFNKPAVIAHGGRRSEFAYGADRARIRQARDLDGGGIDETTVYVGGVYEKTVSGAGSAHRHYIRAGGAVIAAYTRWDAGGEQTRYLYRDHLGSVSVIASASGQLIERLATPTSPTTRSPTGIRAGISCSRLRVICSPRFWPRTRSC